MVSGIAFVAATYGLVRLAYGLFLPDVQAEIGMSSGVAGLVASGSSLIYCGAAGIGFVLGERWARGQIVAAAVTAIVGVWGMAGSTGVGAFALFAVVSSAGAGLASPALVTIVARTVAPPGLERAQSTVNAGTGPGVAVAGVLALIALPDWRAAWWLVGAVTAAIVVALLAADRGGASARAVVDVMPVSASWLRAHTAPLAAAVLMGAGSSVVWTYGRSVLVDSGAMTDRGTVGAWILLGLGATVVIATAGSMSRLPSERAWVLTCAVLSMSVLALGVGSAVPAIALPACAAFGWGFTAGTSALIAWTSSIDIDRAGRGTAMLFVALVFGQAAGTAVLGAAVDAAGYLVAFVAASVVSVAATAPAIAQAARSAVNRYST